MTVSRAVALPELDVGMPADGPASNPMSASHGPMRSTNARSARRRKSPYHRPFPSGPPSTGVLCDTMEAMEVSTRSGLRSSTRRNSSDAMPRFGGPLSRQLAKEAEWKAKLAGERQSWWGVAAMGLDPAMMIDPAAAGAALDAAAAPTGKGAGMVESASQAALRTLARGRNHARADIASVEQWRRAAVDQFLSGGKAGAAPAPPVQPSPLVPASAVMPTRSPGHFERKYGNRGRLPSLSARQRSRLRVSADASHVREEQNAAMRRRVFTSVFFEQPAA